MFLSVYKNNKYYFLFYLKKLKKYLNKIFIKNIFLLKSPKYLQLNFIFNSLSLIKWYFE